MLFRSLPDNVQNEPSTVIRNLRGAVRAGSARPPVPIVAKPSTPASAVAGGRL